MDLHLYTVAVGVNVHANKPDSRVIDKGRVPHLPDALASTSKDQKQDSGQGIEVMSLDPLG